eukprot:4496536-Lingulodinium_polyedra.AAC.1
MRSSTWVLWLILHRVYVGGCPEWMRNGLCCWRYVESTLASTVVSTTECTAEPTAQPIVDAVARCRLNVE